jgi:hypothetical protein
LTPASLPDLAFLPIVLLVLGIGIHAVVDARRKATGSPAQRLGWFFALLTALLAFATADTPARPAAWAMVGGLGALAVGHLVAARWFRVARNRAPET